MSHSSTRRIIIGSDHGGLGLKTDIILFLRRKGYVVEDVGTQHKLSCDFPRFAAEVAKGVSLGAFWRGIMCDTVGFASAIVCNKFPRVYAAVCSNPWQVQMAREHSDANCLCLGEKTIQRMTLEEMIDIFLATAALTALKYTGRRDQIKTLETRNQLTVPKFL